MRVAVFINSRTPEAGGSYTFESQLIDVLLELHSESRHTFICYVSDRSIPNYISASSVRAVSIDLTLGQKINFQISLIFRALLHKLWHPRSQFKIEGWRDRHVLNLLKLDRIDLILSLTPSCPTIEYPYITTVWDLQHKLQSYFPEVSTGGEWELREEFHLKMLNHAALILTGTETGKAEIERFYQIPAARIKVIPMFTPQLSSNVDLSDRDIIAKYKLPDRYLFYPAQFWPHKNHIGLLLAIKCLQEKYDLEVSLVLVGADKGNEPYIREMVEELNLSARVYFLGFVPQQEMASLYRNAFAMTFMTFFGPDNLPPLEAMALGCPTIASNVSGAKEQLGDAALLVDPQQPAEIAAAIHSLFKDDNLRQRIIELGFKRANEWNAKDYLREIFTTIDDFEAIRRCWK